MRTRRVEAYPITGVTEEAIPQQIELGSFENGREYVDGLLSNIPFVYENKNRSPSLPFNGLEDETEELSLRQLSVYHGRSFEVSDPYIPEAWVDTNGHKYTGFNLKGNNVEFPHLQEQDNLPSGHTVWGLMDSDSIGRAMRASRVLRESGISTEFILGFGEPKTYPYSDVLGVDSHRNLQLKEFKQELVSRFWTNLETDKTFERLGLIHNALDRTTYYVSARAMDTSIRLADLEDKKCLEEVISVANKHFKSDSAEPYTADDEGTIRFLNEVAAPRLAMNFAKLHTKGIAHRYPGSLNLTALGSPVDLDSVHGEALELGDDPIQIEDIYKDVLDVGYALSLVTNLPMLRVAIKNKEDYDNLPPSPVNAFIIIYCTQLLEYDEANGTNLFDQLRQYAFENKHSEFISSSPKLQSILIPGNAKEITQKIIDFSDDTERDEEYIKVVERMNTWASEQDPQDIAKIIIEKHGREIVSEIGELVRSVFEDEIRDLKDDFMSEFTYGKLDKISHGIIAEFMYSLVMERIGALYLEQNPEDVSKITANRVSVKEVHFDNRRVKEFSDLYQPVMSAYMKEYFEVLSALVSYASTDPLIDDPDHVEEGPRSIANIYAHEYTFITNDRLIDIISGLPNAKITFSHFGEFTEVSDLVGVYEVDDLSFIVSDGYCLTGIMSGGFVDGYVQDYDENDNKLLGLGIDKRSVKNSNYIAFIQEDESDEILIEVQLIDQHEIFPDLENMETSVVLDKLRYLHKDQGKLFDDSVYSSTRMADYMKEFKIEIKPA